MVKLLFAGIWVCIVTLGAVYFSVEMATAPVVVDEEAARQAALEVVPGESITVPMIADGKVKGYFLSKISFMVDKEKAKGLHLPMTELMTDELFTLLVGNKMVDITNITAFDVATFRDTIKTDMNAKLGEGMVNEVLIEQLDYFSKDDIRANDEGTTKPPSQPVKIVEGQAPATPAKTGH